MTVQREAEEIIPCFLAQDPMNRLSWQDCAATTQALDPGPSMSRMLTPESPVVLNVKKRLLKEVLYLAM